MYHNYKYTQNAKALKISVIMSVFNGEKYIKEAVESILDQTYQDFEFIIVNDASTDNTEGMLEQFNDSRINIIRNDSNLGLTKSLNIALKHARGEYIARMDADDISHPLRFEKQVMFLENNKECLVVGTWLSVIDEKGREYGTWGEYESYEDIRNGLLIKNQIGHGSAMIRRIALYNIGGYDEKFLFAQDYDLWLKLSEIGELWNIPEQLYSLRFWPECTSIAKKDLQAEFASLAREDALKRRSRDTDKGDNG